MKVIVEGKLTKIFRDFFFTFPFPGNPFLPLLIVV